MLYRIALVFLSLCSVQWHAVSMSDASLWSSVNGGDDDGGNDLLSLSMCCSKYLSLYLLIYKAGLFDVLDLDLSILWTKKTTMGAAMLPMVMSCWCLIAGEELMK